MSDAGAVRVFRTATHREGGVEPRLVAMRDFLANASDAEVARNRGLIESQIEAVAAQQPETAARMLAEVLGRDPQGRYPRAVDAVLRWWVVQPGDGFTETWNTLERALANGPRPLERALLDVLGGLDPRAPVRHWRVAATTRVLERLEERFEQPSRHPDHDLWRLLPVVAPPGAPTGRGDWACVLGDRAAARGDEAEARTCYRLAFEQGYAAAAPRLAHRLAVEGHRELSAGDPARAVRFLYEAAMLDPDHAEYRELHRAAVAARDGGPAAGARPGSAAALFTEAVELLERGDDMGAVRLLRRGLPDAEADADARAAAGGAKGSAPPAGRTRTPGRSGCCSARWRTTTRWWRAPRATCSSGTARPGRGARHWVRAWCCTGSPAPTPNWPPRWSSRCRRNCAPAGWARPSRRPPRTEYWPWACGPWARADRSRPGLGRSWPSDC